MGKYQKTLKKMAGQKILYLMIVPCMIYTFIFSYYPLSGWIMAFQNYKPAKGYAGSTFVGLDQFMFLFEDVEFWRSVRNTLMMSVMNLAFSFVFAIVFALLLNEIKSLGLKRITQTVSYLPHFLSWIIVCSLVSNILSTNDGMLNNILMGLGLIDKPVLWLGEQKYFWWVTTFSNIWKETGWNSIIYIAAISGIDQSLYEAAELDGAGRFQKMWHVTLPQISPTIIILFIFAVGGLMASGHEKIILLYNSLTYETADVIASYVYRRGLQEASYSFATAVGLISSAVNFLLLWFTNRVSKKYSEISIF